MFSADQCRKALAQMLPPNGVKGRRALDLVCLAVIYSGNDYIPAMPSAPLDTVTIPINITQFYKTQYNTMQCAPNTSEPSYKRNLLTLPIKTPH